MNEEKPKESVNNLIGLMEILNKMDVGNSSIFIANNQRFVIIKVSNEK